eukprot:TRINITY_DN12142_c0_g2_i27.p2 TRINITY_DN12142_c0_g2~~TRINITY_DN12142_c0_g2_i27.p2  ORF type:complete len:170 (+),score=18.40 TRINITY_DN12142_c0_g2_i27:138-647(+)
MAAEAITVNVKLISGSSFSVDVAADIKIEDLRTKLAEQSEIPSSQQRLVYSGRILKDGQTLSSYGFKSNHALHLVKAATTQVIIHKSCRQRFGMPDLAFSMNNQTHKQLCMLVSSANPSNDISSTYHTATAIIAIGVSAPNEPFTTLAPWQPCSWAYGLAHDSTASLQP